jgi:hypothetical protein
MTIGYIYAITSPNTPYCYVGSTKSIKKRWGHHNDDFRRYLLNKPVCKNGRKMNYKTSFEILKCGNCSIQEIDCIEYTDRKELFELEFFYINLIPNVLNKNNPAGGSDIVREIRIKGFNNSLKLNNVDNYNNSNARTPQTQSSTPSHRRSKRTQENERTCT